MRDDQKIERARTEALFKKERQMHEGARAMAEYPVGATTGAGEDS